MEKTAYEILGVSETATEEEIKRRYHTLMRNLHPDRTASTEISDEQRKENLGRVKEYNEAFDRVSKGRRKEYDQLLAKQRGLGTVYEKTAQTTYKKSSMEDLSEKKIIDEIIERHFDELLKSIFQNGTSFYGSFSDNPKQNLKQDYWKLKSEKEKMERDLRITEEEVRIEFRKKNPTNDIQLGIDSRNIASEISSLEVKRRDELHGIAQSYFFRLNKRFMTDKKRQSLLQEQRQEEDKINSKYNLLLDLYNRKKEELEKNLMSYQKAEKEAVENNPRVQTIKHKLEQVRNELEIIGVKLGYQSQTSSYTSEYGVEYH